MTRNKFNENFEVIEKIIPNQSIILTVINRNSKRRAYNITLDITNQEKDEILLFLPLTENEIIDEIKQSGYSAIDCAFNIE